MIFTVWGFGNKYVLTELSVLLMSVHLVKNKKTATLLSHIDPLYSWYFVY